MYQYPDFSKYFDPSTFTTNMSKMMDFSQFASTTSSQMETYKKLSNIWAETYTKCSQKQMQMAQSCMEDTIEAMRELSTCKGIEELMSKQAELTRKSTEKYQSSAQELASCLQKGQTQCTDAISQMMQQSWTQTTNSASK